MANLRSFSSSSLASHSSGTCAVAVTHSFDGEAGIRSCNRLHHVIFTIPAASELQLAIKIMCRENVGKMKLGGTRFSIEGAKVENPFSLLKLLFKSVGARGRRGN